MSNLYDPKYTRNKFGKFNDNKNIISLVAGTDAYFLEDEYNESQKIINERIKGLLTRKCHSGVICDFDVNDLITQPNDKYRLNLFSFKEMEILINGMLADIKGNLGDLTELQVIKDEGINNVILPEPPSNGTREDFVYLEMWFAEINYLDDLWAYGNVNNYGGILVNDLFDARINGETCRRLQLQWAIRVVSDVDFNKYPYGFEDVMYDKDCKVFAQGNRPTLAHYNFWRGDLNLDGKYKFDDKGLWVAGKGIPSEMGTIDGYVYAMPLFAVHRRNTRPYSVINYNGSKVFDPNKDLNFSDRPDGKFANIIFEDDIRDLRSVIDFNGINYQQVLQDNYTKLITGTLDNSYTTKMMKEYFGLEPITPDDKTAIYLNFNRNILNLGMYSPSNTINRTFRYVPGVEQDAVIIDSGYLKYDISTISDMGAVGLMIKQYDYNDKNLWSIIDANGNMVLACDIIDNKLIISDTAGDLTNIALITTTINLNEFVHIGVTWSRADKKMLVMVNGNLIDTIDITGRFVSGDLRNFVVGYNQDNPLFCLDTIIDEVEFARRYSSYWATLPGDFMDGHAKIAIDMQSGRRKYVNNTSKEIITSFVTTQSDTNGKVIFNIDAPTGSFFTNEVPKVYHDNEAELADTIWSGFGTDRLKGTITGLGAGIIYNLVVIYELEHDKDQGLSAYPKKIYRIIGEKLTDPFLSVSKFRNVEKQSVSQLAINADVINSDIDNLKIDYINVYQPELFKKLGFGCSIQYHIKGNGTDKISIPMKLYGEDVVAIYNVGIKDSLDKTYILKNYVINGNQYDITLSTTIDADEILELTCGITLPICVYNFISGGIENLAYNEKVQLYGDGKATEFNIRFETRVLNSMASNLGGNVQYIAYVNNVPTPIDVQFKDTFIKLIFPKAPANKASIVLYVVNEYFPMRSERFQVWYEAVYYNSKHNIDYINALNDCEIIATLNNSILTLTEGNYIDGITVNKDYISTIFLPIMDDVDYKLLPTPLMGDATNIRCDTDYAIMNDNEFNNPLPFMRRLKLNINDKKVKRGYTGYATVDNKSFLSNFSINKDIPHLNVLPLLVKDKNDQLKMVVITSYKEDNKICIDANYEQSAIDVFNLGKNILVKN